MMALQSILKSGGMISRILCLFKRISATVESIVVLSKFKDLKYVKNDMLKFSWRSY